MRFFGCDGGSTKTELLLVDDAGRVLAHQIHPACNYIAAGQEVFVRQMGGMLDGFFAAAGCSPTDVTAFVYGLTGCSEQEGMEAEIPRALGRCAPEGRTLLVNDGVVGLAGSLGGGAGIHVVAGTGSIVCGDDGAGNIVRAGGWSLLLDDEGSGCWIGRQLLACFFRQADGREPRTELYHMVRKHFCLGDSDLHLIGRLRGIENDKAGIARLQLLAEQAALAGDTVAETLYAQAAEGLARQVKAVWERLQGGAASFPVSYSGGVFKSGELILRPFRQQVEALGLGLTAPRFSPILGAVALAARKHLKLEAVAALLERVEASLS